MNLDYSRKSTRDWNDENKGCWARRSGLERKLIIVLVILGLLSTGYVIYYFITHAATAEICNTPGCLLAASQIIAHVDSEIDPCEDFFKFSCGKLLQSTYGDTNAISKLGIADLIERQTKEIIEEPIKDDDHYLVKNQKLLLQACMNETAVETESLDIFKETIEELGGWPVVVGYDWIAKRFDWQDMIYQLRERGYDYSMMLDVGVINDFNNTNTAIILEPMVDSIKDEHKELYKRYMSDVAVFFGAGRRLADIEIPQVLDFMEKLEQIVDQSFSRYLEKYNETNYNVAADVLRRTFTVEDFQNNHDQMDWLEFINKIISPLASISNNDCVIFPDPEFLDEFFYLLYKTPRRIQANYIIWKVLESIMPYMSKELQQIKANYTCSTEKPPSPQDRSEFCKEIVETSFPSEIMEVLYARKYFSAEKKEQVEELFENIKSELITSIMEATWMDEESKANSAVKADAVTGIIGFDEDYLNDTIFDKFVTADDIPEDFENSTFLNMLLKTQKQLTDMWYYEISASANASNIQLDTLLYSDFNIMHSSSRNTLLLKPKLLQGVYYHQERPKYLNYGALGSGIGQALTAGFDKIANLQSINESIFWTEDTEKAFKERMECFTNEIENFGLEDNATSMIDKVQAIEEYIFNSAGIKLSYAAYKNWAQKNVEEPQLPGIEYTPFQLFWISAMLPQCYLVTEEELSSEYVTIPMRNNADFADDFSCSADSKMNPSEKCELY